jgi:hypothetical protein
LLTALLADLDKVERVEVERNLRDEVGAVYAYAGDLRDG